MMSFLSIFAERLFAYLELRRSLGFNCKSHRQHLQSFDTYACQRNHTGPLTQELALSFALSNAKNSSNHCAHRYQVVRHFSEYLAIYDPTTPVGFSRIVSGTGP